MLSRGAGLESPGAGMGIFAFVDPQKSIDGSSRLPRRAGSDRLEEARAKNDDRGSSGRCCRRPIGTGRRISEAIRGDGCYRCQRSIEMPLRSRRFRADAGRVRVPPVGSLAKLPHIGAPRQGAPPAQAPRTGRAIPRPLGRAPGLPLRFRWDHLSAAPQWQPTPHERVLHFRRRARP